MPAIVSLRTEDGCEYRAHVNTAGVLYQQRAANGQWFDLGGQFGVPEPLADSVANYQRWAHQDIRPKDQFCEHCGSGPECIVCERGQP